MNIYNTCAALLLIHWYYQPNVFESKINHNFIQFLFAFSHMFLPKVTVIDHWNRYLWPNILRANTAFSACLSKHMSYIHLADTSGVYACVWIDFHKTLNEIVIGWVFFFLHSLSAEAPPYVRFSDMNFAWLQKIPSRNTSDCVTVLRISRVCLALATLFPPKQVLAKIERLTKYAIKISYKYTILVDTR